MSEEELTELERKIAYHDEVLCDPFCSNDISTYPNPPHGWKPRGERRE